jgi:Histidine kinase-, DNA gyrase B-, and HSP90-like ATPase
VSATMAAMTTVQLEAKSDHILRLAGVRDPFCAIAEMIWNAVDAEATTVDVHIELNAVDGVGEVIVSDNDHGMNHQECLMHFRHLGGSWKLRPSRRGTSSGPLHGKNGTWLSAGVRARPRNNLDDNRRENHRGTRRDCRRQTFVYA